MIFKNATIKGIILFIIVYSPVYILAMNAIDNGTNFPEYTISSKHFLVLLFTFFTFAIIEVISRMKAKKKSSKLDSNIINP